jgi:hypothetical protein
MRRALVSIVLAACTMLVGTSAVSASTGFHPEAELTRSACPNVVGTAVINVAELVTNDSDSGVAGNNWALDRYVRQISVYKTSTAGTYCAVVTYGGGFVTFAGASPQNTGTVSAGIPGLMYGGRRATIVGSLNAHPSLPTHGFIGTYDYRCDITGTCPGFVSWTSLYFNSVSTYSDDWWGWKYITVANGSWVNSLDGSTGDITGTAPAWLHAA